MAELTLTIELVPRPLWGRSLKKLAPPKEWERLRDEVLERDKHCCRVCGADGNVCHEIWYYDDVNHVQRLTGFITLCRMCSFCKHLGQTYRLWREGKSIDLDAVVDHFCRVNGISREVYFEVSMAASRQWQERNKHTWTQDFGEYSHLVPQ